MKIELQAYSNNILLSCLHGSKVLSEKSTEVRKCKKFSTYSPNGQIKQNTVGGLFDRRV